jgi:hypothetical protein
VSEVTTPTDRVKLYKHKTFIDASKAIERFFYKILKYYNMSTEVTERGWLKFKLKVEVTAGRGGAVDGFRVLLGVYSTPFVMLHELWHYRDYLRWRKSIEEKLELIEKGRAKVEMETNEEAIKKETEADTFGCQEFSKWNPEYRSKVYPLQLKFARHVDVVYKAKSGIA